MPPFLLAPLRSISLAFLMPVAACALGSDEEFLYSTPVGASEPIEPRPASPSPLPLPTASSTKADASVSEEGHRSSGQDAGDAGDARDDSGATELGSISWSSDATAFRCRRLERFAFTCPRDGVLGNAYGSSIYSDDSSICTAAVHEGKITASTGGRVIIEMRPGERIYRSSTRNGVTTRAYSVADGAPDWPCSFVLYPW